MKSSRLLLLLPVALFLIVPANAARPTQVTTTASSGPANLITTQTVNGVTYLTLSQDVVFTGGMVGSSHQVFTLVCSTTCSTGSYTVSGTGNYTGTVDGSSTGTAQYAFSAFGNFSPYSQNGVVIFGHGTGGLAGLHMQGSYLETSPSGTSLTLKAHFTH